MIDNRSPKVRLLDDIHNLLMMAAINTHLIESALDTDRAFEVEGENYKFCFPAPYLDCLQFAAQELEDRARTIIDRLDLLDAKGSKE